MYFLSPHSLLASVTNSPGPTWLWTESGKQVAQVGFMGAGAERTLDMHSYLRPDVTDLCVNQEGSCRGFAFSFSLV